MKLRVLPGTYAVCRLEAEAPFPGWASGSRNFLSLTRTEQELSVVCEDSLVPPGVKAETGWRALRVEGPLDLALTGVLASLTAPLATAGVAIFAVATFDTDYLLVRNVALETALAALRESGFLV